MKKYFSILFLAATVITVQAQNPDRSGPPVLGKAKNLQLPPIQKFTLSNGVRIVLIEKHTVPLAQINLLVQSGSFDDPAGKEGLSNFALDVMDEGANGMDALKLADEIEYLGSSIITYSNNFASGVNCSTPVSRIEGSIKLMSDIALKPTFAEADIERLRKLRLNGLLQNYDEPNAIARRAIDKYIYGSLPYGRAASEASIKSFSKNDLVAFHKAAFVEGKTTFIIVGDVTRQSITPLLEKYFGAYPAGTGIKASIPAPAQIKGRMIYLVDKPGAAQSVIRIGRIGTSRTDPDYNNLTVMNTILGGSFASRLNNNLREQHGYSYGASSGFSFWPFAGPFIATSSVQTDVTGPALGEFFIEFNKMRQPIPEGDITRGKNYVALGYAGDFETNFAIASQLTELVTYGLTDDYFNTFVGKILAVNKKDVEVVAKKYVVPDNMLIIIVGDRAKIDAGVKKLNLGKITYLSVEDVLGKKPQL